MSFTLNERSENNLVGVHPDLVRVVRRAIVVTNLNFIVTEGLRTPERQIELVNQGASHTLNSRHITGHAIDVVAELQGEIRWDWQLYVILARVFTLAARECNVAVEWGGDWQALKWGTDYDKRVAAYVAKCKREGRKALLDGPHFQLPREQYGD